jgi:hypothetical protein
MDVRILESPEVFNGAIKHAFLSCEEIEISLAQKDSDDEDDEDEEHDLLLMHGWLKGGSLTIRVAFKARVKQTFAPFHVTSLSMSYWAKTLPGNKDVTKFGFSFRNDEIEWMYRQEKLGTFLMKIIDVPQPFKVPPNPIFDPLDDQVITSCFIRPKDLSAYWKTIPKTEEVSFTVAELEVPPDTPKGKEPIAIRIETQTTRTGLLTKGGFVAGDAAFTTVRFLSARLLTDVLELFPSSMRVRISVKQLLKRGKYLVAHNSYFGITVVSTSIRRD